MMHVLNITIKTDYYGDVDGEEIKVVSDNTGVVDLICEEINIGLGGELLRNKKFQDYLADNGWINEETARQNTELADKLTFGEDMILFEGGYYYNHQKFSLTSIGTKTAEKIAAGAKIYRQIDVESLKKISPAGYKLIQAARVKIEKQKQAAAAKKEAAAVKKKQKEIEKAKKILEAEGLLKGK